MRRAHPRSRGENSARPGRATRSAGSSPLTRGKPAPGPALGQYPGLIPAHAGKTRPPGDGRTGPAAHPRSRGENSVPAGPSHSVSGSSPLTRGKRLRGRLSRRSRRLIPAHAGKTWLRGALVVCVRAHPRSRGENTASSRRSMASAGSSPLTRGKLCIGCVRGACVGLIPAHAGKTSQCARVGIAGWAHPRSRGENTAPPAIQAFIGWLIPAHAGKTQRDRPRPHRDGAHPRSRGENGAGVGLLILYLGSSPLTRGKRGTCDDDYWESGLIPAHAGKTVSGSSTRQRGGAHPRSRGENKVEGLVGVADLGSSPLTRGKPTVWSASSGYMWLIPAHAGKTGS